MDKDFRRETDSKRLGVVDTDPLHATKSTTRTRIMGKWKNKEESVIQEKGAILNEGVAQRLGRDCEKQSQIKIRIEPVMGTASWLEPSY
jgi:uncharacterized protein YtpQ (UPF0354 family)